MTKNMERISNRYQDLMSQVRQKLETVECANGDILISYSELPWFPGGQFCVSVINDKENNRLKIIRQNWDNEYDLKRFSSGVYNLDRLCIKKIETELSSNRESELIDIVKSIARLPDTLNDQDYVTLDGIDYKLMLNIEKLNIEYQWKIATKDIIHFEPLVRFLLAFESDD